MQMAEITYKLGHCYLEESNSKRQSNRCRYLEHCRVAAKVGISNKSKHNLRQNHSTLLAFAFWTKDALTREMRQMTTSVTAVVCRWV